MFVESTTAACLLPLREESQSMRSLVERWRKLRSVYSVTLELIPEEEALDLVIQTLTALEGLGYVFLELCPIMP